MKEFRGGARRSGRSLTVLVLVVASSATTVAPATAGPRPGAVPTPAPAPWIDSARVSADSVVAQAVDSLFGLSGMLRVKLISDLRILEVGPIARLFGGRRVDGPGVYTVDDTATKRPFSLIALLPFTAKSGSKVGSYLVGSWPGERRAQRAGGAYVNPAGFIRVTPENQNTQVSEHFRLRDFLTKDQQNVWPKYLVLREPLVDKLELIIQDLATRGISVKRMTVMSGFRTPQYNQRGVGKGRAVDSRHQFGDAADVFVDNDGNGRMDDLNRDGRVDHRDAQVILDASDRIERAYPTLVGGGGLYRATRAHGPFAHIDVRGSRARWGT